jgi:hypothetical protein
VDVKELANFRSRVVSGMRAADRKRVHATALQRAQAFEAHPDLIPMIGDAS